MYSRGGYVQILNNENGLIFLEEDWDESRLPEDLVQEAGLMGTSYSILNWQERARLGGYVKKGEFIQFTVNTKDYPHIQTPNTEIFLVSNLNNWNYLNEKDRWKLELDSSYSTLHTLNLKWNDLKLLDSFRFKFITDKEEWFEPNSSIPCSKENGLGTSDFLFDSRRTGKDIISFNLVEGPGNLNLEDWLTFEPKGNFGYFKSPKGSIFRVFAPRVSQVDLLLNSNSEETLYECHPMKKSNDGSWKVELPFDCEGSFYKYAIKNIVNHNNFLEFKKEVVDPYARAMVARDGPGIAISPNCINSRTTFIAPKVENIVILETHIRDLLVNAPVDLNENERLEFRGLTKWLVSEDCYLRKLGVNAIQLQPIHEFDARTKREYHWGYMSVNFFAPASTYASDPKNGSNILEFKNLVNALHDAGLAVIVDVVYNHVGVPSHLSFLDRELYFSTDSNGKLTNHSGCGNDINAESGAVQKLIVDSLLSMINDFKIDGFRFDLGEIIGFELLLKIQTELQKNKPNLILIAEPWSFRGRLPIEMKYTNYSLWSDNCREKLLEFVKGKGNSEEMINLLKGKLDQNNLFPWQSVNYLESHDDFTFVDRLCSHEDWKIGCPPDKIIRKAKIAMALLLLSPGIPMIASGQDYLRSKKGVQNTYLRGDLNALNYELFSQCEDFHLWTKKILSFRSSLDGKSIRLKEFLHDQQYKEIFGPENSFGLIIFSSPNNEDGFLLFFLVNPDDKKVRIPIPDFLKNRKTKFVLGSKTSSLGILNAISIQVWKVESKIDQVNIQST